MTRLLDRRCAAAGALLVSTLVALLASDAILRALHHAHPRNYEFRAHAPSGEYGGYLVSDERRPVYRWAFMGDSFVEAICAGFPGICGHPVL